MLELILASASPRRRELLTTAGIPFRVRSRPVEEIRAAGEPPVEYVKRLARAKAEAAWEGRDEIVLGADTTVVLGDQVLEKPSDADEASAMLHALSGRIHQVVTGICLRHRGGAIIDAESTSVHFVEMDASEIADYVASGEPMDKAGAYAIQGLASKLVDRIARLLLQCDGTAAGAGVPAFEDPHFAITPFHLRMTSSARFRRIAKIRNPGHNCMVDAMDRLPASNTALDRAGIVPPVNSATCLSSASFEP